jgi:hypothetical protein
MPVVGFREAMNALKANCDAIDADHEARVDEIVLDAAIRGEETIRRTIDTTPSGLSPGKDNRNWTFQMRNAVDSKVTKRGRIRKIQAGWLGLKEKYFLFQETGTDPEGKRPPIPPMHALVNANNEIRRYLDEQFRLIEKRKT